MLGWINISGANGKNLTIATGLKQTTFYRRKVTETTSGSISYSNVATVDVIVPIPAAHSYINQNDSNLAEKDNESSQGKFVNVLRQVLLQQENKNNETTTII